MASKKVFSNLIQDGGTIKVAFDFHGFFHISGPGGDLICNFKELQQLMMQAQDLIEAGVAIPLQRVESSNIEAAGHYEKSNTLRIKFKGGGLYDYDGVPKKIFDELISAESAGRYFHAKIKTAHYPYMKIDTEEENDESEGNEE